VAKETFRYGVNVEDCWVRFGLIAERLWGWRALRGENWPRNIAGPTALWDRDRKRLAEDWPDEGPKELWRDDTTAWALPARGRRWQGLTLDLQLPMEQK